MSKIRKDIIRCPKCGAEYLAGEIYIPNEFLGVPNDVEREVATHKILNDFGKPMNTNERFICDYCNTPFIIKAHVNFSTEIDTDFDFSEPHSTSMKKATLFLKED